MTDFCLNARWKSYQINLAVLYKCIMPHHDEVLSFSTLFYAQYLGPESAEVHVKPTHQVEHLALCLAPDRFVSGHGSRTWGNSMEVCQMVSGLAVWVKITPGKWVKVCTAERLNNFFVEIYLAEVTLLFFLLTCCRKSTRDV